VDSEALTQADIARRMGITRQSVQRTSHLLLKEGYLEAIENPSHKQANLLQPSEKGYEALSEIRPMHEKVAGQVFRNIGEFGAFVEDVKILGVAKHAVAFLPGEFPENAEVA